MRIQRELDRSVPVLSVVLNSGEPNEQIVKPEVLCQMEDPDLAILRVSSLRSAPKAIEFRQTIQLAETMPVFILGFPFGDALSANKANPNITIGKGSVSSIRKDQSGKVVKIQIDGAVNPGNSGGPVVDGHGNLVGIAVQRIQGSNIGLSIPASAVSTMLEGSLGKPTITVTTAVNGAEPKYEIVVPLIDPLKKLKSASVHFVPKSIPVDPAKAGQAQLAGDAASRKLDLSLRSGVARAELPLDAKASLPTRQVTVQASFVTKEGKTVYLDPQVVAVPRPIRVATTNEKGGPSSTNAENEWGGDDYAVRPDKTTTPGGSSTNRSSTPGGKKKESYKVGDKVLVDWAGKTYTAEVLGFAPTGWIKVEFAREGFMLTPTLPPDQIKPMVDAEKKKALAGATLRTWTDKGSKFKVDAKFVELANGSVKLEKEDGETVTIALDKLSEADQRIARQLADQAEDNPFVSKPKQR